MKALTYAGRTGELPVDTKIVEKGTMILGASEGDQIISYFTVDDINYACHEGVCSLTKGTVGKAMRDSELPKRTGFLPGDQYNYAVYHDGQYRAVVWTENYAKEGHTLWKGYLSDVVSIQDNPYYSLDPYWPSDAVVDYTVTPYALPPTTHFADRYLYKYIKWINYLPKYYQSLNLTLLEGTGKLTSNAKNISQSTYHFSKADIDKKQVRFIINCVPLKNSGSKDTQRVITLKW